MGALPTENLSKKERRELKRQEKLSQRSSSSRGQTLRRVGIWVLIFAVLGAVVYGLIRLGGGARTNTSPGGTPAPVNESDQVFGNPDATDTLIEYSDFECPACAAAEPALLAVRRDFARDVRIVYRHFPLMQHPLSKPAAYAAEAAGRQGKFWEMHDLLFARQKLWVGDKDKAVALFIDYAKELELNVDQFVADMNSGEVIQKVADQGTEAYRAGVDATPTFYLNGRKLQLRSFNEIGAEIQAEQARLMDELREQADKIQAPL